MLNQHVEIIWSGKEKGHFSAYTRSEMTFLKLYPFRIIQLREALLQVLLLRGAQEPQPWGRTCANDVYVLLS